MIVLHNLRGEEFALNAELIERVEQDSETHVTLVTGTSYVVRESEQQVVYLHRLDRAEVQVLAGRIPLASSIDSAPTGLRLVDTNGGDEGREST